MPHLAVDPVVCAAHVVTAAQTLASREADPASEGCVVSITRVSAGKGAYNVIGQRVKLAGTLRALTSGGFERLRRR